MFELIGKFTRFIFISDNADFFVALFKVQKSNNENIVNTITISGKIKVEINLEYKIFVSESKNSKYKNTWVLEKVEEILPAAKKDIVNFLSSSKFPGIGKKVAEKVFVFFGDSTIEILNKQPEQIFDKELDIADSKKKILFEIFENKQNNQKLEEFFIKNNLSLTLLNELIKNYDVEKIENIIEENPYQFLDKLDFRYFNDIDSIGRVMNFSNDSLERISYIFLNEINKICFNSGSTMIKVAPLYQKLKEILFLKKEKYIETIRYMEEKSMIFIYQNKFILSYSLYQKEIDISFWIKHLIKNKKSKFDFLDCKIDYFDEIQNKALNLALKENISIITGGPGTGKTEILKQIINKLQEKYSQNEIAVLAPTGRAAYRIFEKTLFDARTIHSFLGARKHEKEFIFNKFNKVDHKILIIDEFSMVNTTLFFHLLNAFDQEKLEKIILIGDPNQIPSIGAGNLLRDFINYSKIKTIYLEKNYRQKDSIGIIEDAALVNESQFPNFEKNESQFYEVSNFDFLDKLDKQLNIFLSSFSIEEITILSPLYEGNWGINKINDYIQKKIFINEKAFEIKDKKYYVGDKVLQNENDADLNVFNGEIGFIETIKTFENKIIFIVVAFPNDKKVKYTLKQFSDYITLGYCISIHKFQGSESPVVILNLLDSKMNFISKKLFYTGITRAQKFLNVIGNKEAIQEAINNNYDDERITYLSQILD